MFENLRIRLHKAIKTLRGQGKITDINVATTMKEIRRALVNADVHYKVAKQVIDTIKTKALGQDVFAAVSPGQLLTKIVSEELAVLMGSEQATLNTTGKPAVILMSGLQGSGKTTFSGKLALHLKQQNKTVLLAACDVYRPAAVDQLQVVGEKIGIEVYAEPGNKNVLQIAQHAVQHAKAQGKNVVIVDTAGRLGVDEAMMTEIAQLKKKLQPTETLFVVDAMTGQDAVNTAKVFNERLDFDGVVLTKLDGDTRGGAALSIRTVVQKPIKLIGTGEKMEAMDTFYPDRMAKRILGMGDVVSLVERAEKVYDEEAQRKLHKKFHKNQFNFDDFLTQIHQIKKMGNMKDLLGMLPGMGKKLKNVNIDDDPYRAFEVMIQSMTPQERAYPNTLNRSRCQRISQGCGLSLQDVNKMIGQFNGLCKTMKKLNKQGSKLKDLSQLSQMFS